MRRFDGTDWKPTKVSPAPTMERYRDLWKKSNETIESLEKQLKAKDEVNLELLKEIHRKELEIKILKDMKRSNNV